MNIVRRDGSLEVRSLRERSPVEAIGILRSEYDVDARELHLTLPAGDRVTVEIGAAGGGADRPGGGRSVVYLDQNHWIALARYWYAPEKQAADINEAAERLIALAQSKAIILPLSSAHLVETARCDGRFRHNLATTMLSLSRGWQLRNPLRVRAHELAIGMRGGDAVAPDAVTLEPGYLFANDHADSEALPDLPKFARDLHRRITTVSAIFDVMIEDEKEDTLRGRELAAKWARIHGKLARRLRDDRVPKDQVRTIALGFFSTDLRDDFARAAKAAGLAPADFVSWMEHDADAAIARMPHLGRLRELILKRLRNADERWRPNDLNDAIYLSCAAAYTDLVVGEKLHTNVLIQTEKAVRPGAHLVWKLPEAVAWLEAMPSARSGT